MQAIVGGPIISVISQDLTMSSESIETPYCKCLVSIDQADGHRRLIRPLAVAVLESHRVI